MQALEEQGCELLTQAASDWVIAHSRHPALWDCMLYFIGLATAHRMCAEHGMHAVGDWVAATQARKPTIVARNVDILLRAGFGNKRSSSSSTTTTAKPVTGTFSGMMMSFADERHHN